MRRTKLKCPYDVKDSDGIRSLTGAVVVASGAWLLILLGVFLRVEGLEPTHSVVNSAAAAQNQWPERYRKYAYYKRTGIGTQFHRSEYRRPALPSNSDGGAKGAPN